MMYLWLKAAHVAGVLLFVGGIFILLLANTSLGSRGMENIKPAGLLRDVVWWWNRRVTLPSMLCVWVFGLWIAISGAWITNGWFLGKMCCVLFLSGLHGVLTGRLRRLTPRDISPSMRPSWLMVNFTLISVFLIVVLVIVKPVWSF